MLGGVTVLETIDCYQEGEIRRNFFPTRDLTVLSMVDVIRDKPFWE